jgi:hypothetical protein
MIKQIPASQLRAGMYLHKLGGAWILHPFWRRSFLLKATDLAQIEKAGIAEAWIDTDRGIDVDGAVVDEPAPGGDGNGGDAPLAEPEVEYVDMPTLPEATMPLPLASAEAVEIDLSRASQICTNATEVVKRLHEDVRMGRVFDLAPCAEVVDEIVDNVMEDAAALLLMVRLKNHSSYAYTHSVATSALMVALARQLNFSRGQMAEAGIAGLMHDVGKLFVPLEILEKPSALTQEEYLLVKTHVLRGHTALLQNRIPSPMVLDVCLHHHERIDGTGYPHGLQVARPEPRAAPDGHQQRPVRLGGLPGLREGRGHLPGGHGGAAAVRHPRRGAGPGRAQPAQAHGEGVLFGERPAGRAAVDCAAGQRPVRRPHRGRGVQPRDPDDGVGGDVTGVVAPAVLIL